MTDSEDGTLHHVATAADLEDGERVIVEIEGREIALFRANGEYHAVLNWCVHQGGPVCEGLLHGTLDMNDDWEWVYAREGEVISCPWHGWEFDIVTGEHLSNSGYRIPTYPVLDEDGELYVRF